MIKFTLIYSSQKLESFYEVAHPRDTCENGSTMNPKELIEENEDASGIVTKIRKVRKNLKRAFKQCKPLSCSCPNGENVPLTMFGCEQGGLPKCPEGSGKKLKCR